LNEAKLDNNDPDIKKKDFRRWEQSHRYSKTYISHSIWGVIYIYSRWFFFVRMDFLEQYHIEDESWDVKCDEKSILSETYQW
jgi:hypothetical protein